MRSDSIPRALASRRKFFSAQRLSANNHITLSGTRCKIRIHDRNTDPEVYRKNLEELANRLRVTGAKLIWVRTTPAPPSGKNNESFTDAQCDQVNRIADEVMQANQMPEVDLYSLVKSNLPALQLPDNVHFKEPGYQLMGSNVAAVVSAGIGGLPANMTKPTNLIP